MTTTSAAPTNARIGPFSRASRGSTVPRAAFPRFEAARTVPRVAVIDASDLVRSGLPLVLRDVTVSAGFSTVAAFLQERPPADVVIFGYQGPAADTPAHYDSRAIGRLTRTGYRVCVFTCEDRPALLARCLRAGAAGIVLKTEPLGALSRAIGEILAGRPAVSGRLAATVTTRAREPELTPRQQQILSGRARGETFRSIAQRLDISVRTAQDHWTAIARRYEEFLSRYSAADLERSLGLDRGPVPLDVS